LSDDGIVLKGRVTSGVGEGAKYVRLYRSVIQRYLGIDPYPGTLNIDFGRDISDLLARLKGRLIPPPEEKYVAVIAYRASVNGKIVYAVRPCITKHGWNILEIIADTNLRREFGLRDGDLVEIIIYREI
jgi:riboflavin kinase